MRIPDLEAEIDEWENAHTHDVIVMTMTDRDKLFKQDSERMAKMIAAVYQISAQELAVEGKATSWIPNRRSHV